MTPTFDDRTTQAATELAAESNPFKKFILRYQWGVRIHEVNRNYLQYGASVSQVKTYLRELRSQCSQP